MFIIMKLMDLVTKWTFIEEVINVIEDTENYHALGHLAAVTGISQKAFNEVMGTLDVPQRKE